MPVAWPFGAALTALLAIIQTMEDMDRCDVSGPMEPAHTMVCHLAFRCDEGLRRS